MLGFCMQIELVYWRVSRMKKHRFEVSDRDSGWSSNPQSGSVTVAAHAAKGGAAGAVNMLNATAWRMSSIGLRERV